MNNTGGYIMDKVQDELQRKYGQTLPDSWFDLANAQCFDIYAENHLQLSDIQWMKPEQILNWVYPADTIKEIMPFAHTGHDDTWCFARMLPEVDGQNPVVFCPLEDEVAFAYAPHFTGFIFRYVLEEYACTCLTESYSPGRSLAILGDYARHVSPFMPNVWAAILNDVSNRPLMELEHGFFGTIHSEEAQQIIETEFADWAEYDLEFEQFLGN